MSPGISDVLSEILDRISSIEREMRLVAEDMRLIRAEQQVHHEIITASDATPPVGIPSSLLKGGP